MYKNLVLDQGNNFYLISLSFLITCLLDNVWVFKGEITCQPLLGVKGLSIELHLYSCNVLNMYMYWLGQVGVLPHHLLN